MGRVGGQSLRATHPTTLLQGRLLPTIKIIICNLQGGRNQELTDNQIQRDQRTLPDKHNHCSDGPVCRVLYATTPYPIDPTRSIDQLPCRTKNLPTHKRLCRTKRLTLPLEAPFRPRTASERATGYSETSSGPCKKYERNPRRDGGIGG